MFIYKNYSVLLSNFQIMQLILILLLDKNHYLLSYKEKFVNIKTLILYTLFSKKRYYIYKTVYILLRKQDTIKK